MLASPRTSALSTTSTVVQDKHLLVVMEPWLGMDEWPQLELHRGHIGGEVGPTAPCHGAGVPVSVANHTLHSLSLSWQILTGPRLLVSRIALKT